MYLFIYVFIYLCIYLFIYLFIYNTATDEGQWPKRMEEIKEWIYYLFIYLFIHHWWIEVYLQIGLHPIGFFSWL